MWKSKPLWIFVLVLASAVAADAAEDGDETLSELPWVALCGHLGHVVLEVWSDAWGCMFLIVNYWGRKLYLHGITYLEQLVSAL